MKKLRVLTVAACGLALFMVGCGKKESGDGNAGSGATASTSGSADTAAPAPATGREIQITGNDQMKFNVTEIRAKAGEALSVTLSNVGTVPKFSMGHNWVLVKPTTNMDDFIAEANQAATTDYVPQSRKNDIIAKTRLLGPKEKDTVTFTAPKEPGQYPFLCSFPGHYQVGMKGVLIVE